MTFLCSKHFLRSVARGVECAFCSFYAGIALQKLATFHGVSIALRVVSHAAFTAYALWQCARNRKRVFGFRVKTENAGNGTAAANGSQLVNECRRRPRRGKKQIVTSSCVSDSDLVLIVGSQTE